MRIRHVVAVVSLGALASFAAGPAFAEGAASTAPTASPTATATPTGTAAPTATQTPVVTVAPTQTATPPTQTAAPGPARSGSPLTRPPAPAAAPAAAAAVEGDAGVTLDMVDEVAVGGSFVIEAAADLVSGSADAVVLTITLPTGLRYAGPTPHTIEDMSCVSTPPTIVCRDADPDVAGGTAAGRFFKLIVDRSVPAGAALTVTAVASVEGADDPVASNDVVTQTTTAVAGDDLTAQWEHADYTAVPGHDVTLVMVVRNEGTHTRTAFLQVAEPEYTAQGPHGIPKFEIVDLPVDAPGRTCFGDPGASYCEFDLGAGEQVRLSYTYTFPASERGHTLVVRGGIDTEPTDPDNSNNSGQALIHIAADQAAPAADPAGDPDDPATQTPAATTVPTADTLPRTGSPVLAYSAAAGLLMLIGSGLCVAGRMMPRKPTCAVPVSTI
jgi:hypothetical protein